MIRPTGRQTCISVLRRGLPRRTPLDWKSGTASNLFPLVVEMAKELYKQDHFRTLEKFEDDTWEYYEQLHMLFHNFHTKTLRSLLLGLLAYDLHDKDSPNWNHI